MKNTFLCIVMFLSAGITMLSLAENRKTIKGFSGGMMVHSGYQYGGDNPFNLNISSPTFGIGGCAKANYHIAKEKIVKYIQSND